MKTNHTMVFLFILFFSTIAYSVSFSQLSGNYTIGTGGNYLTISDAVNNLNSNGVSGPVTFSIKPGSYGEFFTINSIPGSGTVNSVTIKSQTGNSSDVILHSEAVDSVLLKINGADNIILEDLTFTDILDSASQRYRIMFCGNCDNIKISKCKFTGGINDAGIISGGSVTKNLSVDQCEFTTKIGIQFTALSAFSEFTKITNSSFNCLFCMEFYYQTSLIIEKNIITGIGRPGYPASFCISIAGCNGYTKVLKNRMYGISDPDGHAVDGIKSDPVLGDSALIANNMISINSGTCITLFYSSNVKIYFNTLRCDLTHSGNISLAHDTNFVIKNNILSQIANDGHRTLIYWLNRISIMSDYNNFYFNGSDMCYYPPYYFIQSLTQFQTLTGFDLHSTNIPVQFVSDHDLHLAGTSIHDSVLVGIPVPEVTDDIDGQPRNPFYPYKGADEADYPLPVELASFTSGVLKNNVTLNWITSAEQNNSGFEIERRVDKNWNKIGFVIGAGNSINQNNYIYEDKNLNSGHYKYRLKQLDFNGNFQYHELSNDIFIGVPSAFSLSQNFPNPFNPVTKILFTLPEEVFVSIMIFDIGGRKIKSLIRQSMKAGYYSVKLDASAMTSGVYFYSIQAGSFSQTKKMMLLK